MRCIILLALVTFGFAADARAQHYGDPNQLVAAWYRNYLGREPDEGMYGWVDQLTQGIPADRVLAGILASPEFYTRAGSTPQGFVNLLYQTILARNATPREQGYWTNRMYTDDRAAVAETLLEQNPGVWIGSGGMGQGRQPVPTPPPAQWSRDRYSDWNRHNDVYDYRRPPAPYYVPRR